MNGQQKRCLFRIQETDRKNLERLIFQRYPAREWGTFFRFGFRRTSWGLVACFVSPERPLPGDLDRSSPITVFRSRYTLRAQHIVEDGPLAVGVIHSHPRNCATFASHTDDDMDGYFAEEFCRCGKGKPYLSVIFSRGTDGSFRFTGRVFDQGEWYPVSELLTVGDQLQREQAQQSESELLVAQDDVDSRPESLTARLDELLGRVASKRRSTAKVGIIGCSGTGSPAAHVLARSGVQDFVLVDPQCFGPSNLERMHGSRFEDALQKAPATKVELLGRLIREINPRARLTCIQGNILDEVVLDALLECDLLLGCTDSQHGRAALGDIAAHYLLSSIDVGVTMAAKEGKLKAQIVEICRHSPELPCPFCLGRIDANLLSFELMTEEDRSQRRQAAAAAKAEGIDGRAYWVGDPAPELTVGYLTTLAGSLAAGYAENLLIGAAEMPHQRFQFDVGLPRFGFNPVEKPRNPDCSCGRTIGYADQARADRSVSRPAHWPQPRVLEVPMPCPPAPAPNSRIVEEWS